MAQRKYISLNKLSTFLDNLNSKFALLIHKHSMSDITDFTVDSTLSPNSNNPVQNKVIDAEFDAISKAMNALESAIDDKADSIHNHNDAYYPREEIDIKLATKLDASHNHDDDYDALGSADIALDSAKEYTDIKTADLASTSVVDNKISTHNTTTDAHNDIRVLISDLTTKINNFLDVDDTTADQLSEVLTLIENNRGTLESLTTNKVNVSDIINNLTTNVSNKPLSAAVGVVIKNLIDALQSEVSGKAPNSHASTTATYGLGNVSSYGHVKLSDETGSTDGVGAGVAATPYAVKLTHDLASSAKTIADSKVSKSGDTMTGALIINASNPYVHFKDTAYSTDWYIQAYQDQYGFGTTWSTAIKSDKNGNMTVVGTATIGNKVKLQYDSANECLNFSFV